MHQQSTGSLQADSQYRNLKQYKIAVRLSLKSKGPELTQSHKGLTLCTAYLRKVMPLQFFKFNIGEDQRVSEENERILKRIVEITFKKKRVPHGLDHSELANKPY